MKQQIVFFEWPSNAGKSTAVGTLLEKYGNFFHINMDRIKWSISDYSNKNPKHKEMLQEMIQSMALIALDKWMSLIIESQRQLINTILNLPQSEKFDIKYINIEAPLSLLKERFQERVENAKREGRKLGNTSEDKLIEIYNNYQDNKFTQWITLDTHKLSEEKVVVEIEKYLWIVWYK